ncbi:MAG: hypothetical protein HGA31_04535 [Candidatus Moranbacteria bacterium]|nr:hypothetical protein [Candidatus Moranbacteria bacterium]
MALKSFPMRRGLVITYLVFVHLFAVAGLVLVGGFFAIRLHATDVKGSVDPNSPEYSSSVLGESVEHSSLEPSFGNDDADSFEELDRKFSDLSKARRVRAENLCSIAIVGRFAPVNAKGILAVLKTSGSDPLVAKMLFAAKIRLEDSGHGEPFRECSGDPGTVPDESALLDSLASASGTNLFPWMNNEEWTAIRSAIVKDGEAIERAATVAGVEPRLLVSCAIVEQVRLFHSQRELFKKVFEPLKILGNANKISLGVMGIKEATAIETEAHLTDPTSPYYLGDGLAHMLDYTAGSDVATERFKRLTEDGDHYYSYLYGALYLRQMLSQWEHAGFDIKYRPEIATTLFNVGFPQSKPNADPKVGGSGIKVGDAEYSFGSLGYEFYYSGELLDAFPFVIGR